MVATTVEIALGVALAATPVGWVLIIGAGLAAGYAGAVAGDFIGRETATLGHDASNYLLSL
ncbi:hypothetical protein [Psychromonas aquimarina]|uniref:hypothetical protein n=1 Tax=Psychromonas aquimarina TaxID=444919 RepID=UPI00048C7975|nr:hypothetical protein [Psychromonas aquimarina]